LAKGNDEDEELEKYKPLIEENSRYKIVEGIVFIFYCCYSIIIINLKIADDIQSCIPPKNFESGAIQN
jgi:hypothetical protein